MHFTHLSLGHTWTYIFTSLTLSHALKYFPSFCWHSHNHWLADQSKTQEIWTVNIIKDYKYQANKCFKFQFFAGNWISIFKNINYAFAFKDSMLCSWNTSKVSSSKWQSISSLVDINLDCCVVWSESSVLMTCDTSDTFIPHILHQLSARVHWEHWETGLQGAEVTSKQRQCWDKILDDECQVRWRQWSSVAKMSNIWVNHHLFIFHQHNISIFTTQTLKYKCSQHFNRSQKIE